MEKRTKQILLFITVGVMLFAMLMNLELEQDTNSL